MFALFLAPILLAINEVPPTVTPTEAAINIKYIGKDLANADKASDEILPAKKVSTILKSVWNKVATLAGIAIFFNKLGIGSLIKFIIKISRIN